MPNLTNEILDFFQSIQQMNQLKVNIIQSRLGLLVYSDITQSSYIYTV